MWLPDAAHATAGDAKIVATGARFFGLLVIFMCRWSGQHCDVPLRLDYEVCSMKAEVIVPDDYRPADDEPFMNDRQLAYFRGKLLAWKNELMSDSKETIETLQDNTRAIPDISDRASEETDRALELRTRDRQRKLVSKIDAALRRIEDGEYGYCEETGDPISLRRLDARPIATMSLEAQERHERREKVHRDD